MGNLVHNPGRGSEDSSQRKSANRGANIFAQKVRKQNKNSAEKSPVGLGTEEDSFQDDHLEASFDKSRRRSKMSKSTPKQNESDYDDESSQSEEREFNLQEEIIFEKSCLNLLNASNWQGLAITAKKHL